MINSKGESEKYDLAVCGIWIFSLAFSFLVWYGFYTLITN